MRDDALPTGHRRFCRRPVFWGNRADENEVDVKRRGSGGRRLDDPGAAGHAAVAIRPDVPIIPFVGGARLKKIRLCEGPGYGNILTLVRGGKAPRGPRSDRRLVPDSDLVGAGLAGREVICESDGKVISADAQGGRRQGGHLYGRVEGGGGGPAVGIARGYRNRRIPGGHRRDPDGKTDHLYGRDGLVARRGRVLQDEIGTIGIGKHRKRIRDFDGPVTPTVTSAVGCTFNTIE